MKIPILCPYWGHEHLQLGIFLNKIQLAGYDGIDSWVPESRSDKKVLLHYLTQKDTFFVAHQHQAEGPTFQKFRTSFKKHLTACLDFNPLLINSHTGRDYFSREQNLVLIKDSVEFSLKHSVSVCHETHRGRFGYAPLVMEEYFLLNEQFELTADFSHWVCVTESLLENFSRPLKEAIIRSRCIHARVGFPQGPQIGDPKDPLWASVVNTFFKWWDKIVEKNQLIATKFLPITTEFGPPPYMPSHPYSRSPLYDQFQINCDMKNLFKQRYSDYTFSADKR